MLLKRNLETYQLGNVPMTIGTSQSMLSLSVDDVKVVGNKGQEEMDILRMDIDMEDPTLLLTQV